MFACASLASSARLADQACVFVLSSAKRIFSPPTRNISAMAKSSDAPVQNSIALAIRPYAAGGMAACFAQLSVQPADTMKTRIQISGRSFVDLAKATYAEAGVAGFYHGLSAAVGRQAVYGTARLGLHRTFSNKMIEAQGGGQLPAYKSILSSMASGAMGSIIGNPFDLSLVRMQTDATRPPDQRRNYKNVFDAISRVVREEGVLRLWRGSAPTVVRAMAVNVGMMASYDQIKYMIVKARGQDDFMTRVVCAGIAGFACAWTSLPFDRIKTTMQDMTPDKNGKLPYKNIVDCGKQLIAKDGLLQMWRGYFTYAGRCAPHAMICLLTMDTFVSIFNKAAGLK